MFRTVGSADDILAVMRPLSRYVAVDEVLRVPPVRMHTVPGFDTQVFPFTTDIPFLDRWGAPLLMGPGSITLAHTADEYCEVAELHRAVDLYADVARSLMSHPG